MHEQRQVFFAVVMFLFLHSVTQQLVRAGSIVVVAAAVAVADIVVIALFAEVREVDRAPQQFWTYGQFMSSTTAGFNNCLVMTSSH